MSYEIDTLDISMKAAGNLSAYQYCFVKISADNTVDVCGDGEQALGVLQNKPSAAGQAARVRVMGASRIIGGETLAFSNKVGSGALGVGMVKSADKAYYNGIVIEGTGTWSAAEVGTILLVGVNMIAG
jgi:hypothetical protein